MKRKELISYLILHGCFLEREGKKHSIFYNLGSNTSATVPRHTEINNYTARSICRLLGIPEIEMK